MTKLELTRNLNNSTFDKKSIRIRRKPRTFRFARIAYYLGYPVINLEPDIKTKLGELDYGTSIIKMFCYNECALAHEIGHALYKSMFGGVTYFEHHFNPYPEEVRANLVGIMLCEKFGYSCGLLYWHLGKCLEGRSRLLDANWDKAYRMYEQALVAMRA